MLVLVVVLERPFRTSEDEDEHEHEDERWQAHEDDWMALKPRQRQPGELEIRIRPDGRVFIAEADEAMLDVCQALDPDNPVVAKRMKAKSKEPHEGPVS